MRPDHYTQNYIECQRTDYGRVGVDVVDFHDSLVDVHQFLQLQLLSRVSQLG